MRQQAGDEGVARLLRAAGETRTAGELESETNWSTYDQKISLFQAAGDVLGDPIVARHIGETVLRQSVGAPLKLLLRALGSPAMVLRNVTKASAKFSTTCTMTAENIERHSAVIVYRLHPGYTPSRHDCDYTYGLLAVVPPLFGLPQADVTHRVCQARGADRCVFEVSWKEHHRLPWRAARERITFLQSQLEAVTDHSQALRSTILDLVSPSDVDTVLRRIAVRAAGAVGAPHFLLSVSPNEGALATVLHEGLPEEWVTRIVRHLETHTDADDRPGGGYLLVSRVESSHRCYGYLVAVYTQVGGMFEGEQPLLDAYARHAAVALDIATALATAERRRESTAALLELSRALARTMNIDETAEALAAAVVPVVGAACGAVLFWDAGAEQLRVAAHSGFSPLLRDALDTFVVGRKDAPDVAEILGRQQASRWTAGSAGPFITRLLDTFSLHELVVLPIVADGHPVALIAAGLAATSVRDELDERLAGVADQAAMALERARLHQAEQESMARLKADEARIRHLAYHDSLTGLPNGRLFREELQAALARSRFSGRDVAVMFIDVDRFKQVNDSLGHPMGDLLLKAVAKRFSSCLRAQDILARLGGDEFSVLLEGTDVQSATTTAERLRATCRTPFDIAGSEIFATISLGMAVAPEDGTTVEELLRNADGAMYAVKHAGRDGLRRYHSYMNADARANLALEGRLYRALSESQLLTYYQPIVSGREQTLLGFEALVRWQDPEWGLLSPGDFVPVAEQSGLIVPLDNFVLNQACRQAAAWGAQSDGPLTVSVNVSDRRLREPGLADAVLEATTASGLDPRCLELEITERCVLEGSDLGGEVRKLADLGVQIVLDDFGTGYSSLDNLRWFPFSRVKIDRSFVATLPEDRHDRAIVETIVRLCHDLGMQVTAEGVETEAQAELLRECECDALQGFAFGHPAPASSYPTSYLRSQPRAARQSSVKGIKGSARPEPVADAIQSQVEPTPLPVSR